MPFSMRENNKDVREFVDNAMIRTVLDVGPGSGTYGRLLREQNVVDRIDAVEIWEPYIETFGLDKVYDAVIVMDVRGLATSWEFGRPAWAQDGWDLIIFGDVLEHMTQDEALEVWSWAGSVARWGLISVPIVHWPQHAVEGGNPYEEHVQDHIHVEDLKRDFGPFAFSWEYDLTGTFVRKFR